MLFYRNDRMDPAFNLALEEVMSEQSDEPFLLLWRNRPAVILGRNQNAVREFDAVYAREHGIAAVRRMTGGGAVYHDPGNVNYSMFAFETAENSRYIDFAPFAKPVLDALSALGVEAEFSGRNDILVNGRKISGSAKSVHSGRILFHGTLLFDVDLDTMAAVLTPSAAKIAAKGVPSVRARVANLREFLPDLDRDSFPDALAGALLHQFSRTAPDPIPPNWIREAERLADERYRSWDWNFGESPDFTVERSGRFPGGEVSVLLKIHHGVIQSASIQGDFFGEEPVSVLEQALAGAACHADAVRTALQGFAVGRFIAGMDLDGLIRLIAL